MAIAGRVALITGAAQGLGKAFSESLLKLGAKVSSLNSRWYTQTVMYNVLEIDTVKSA